MSLKIEKGGGIPEFGQPSIEKGKEKEGKPAQVAQVVFEDFKYDLKTQRKINKIATRMHVQSHKHPMTPARTDSENDVYFEKVNEKKEKIVNEIKKIVNEKRKKGNVFKPSGVFKPGIVAGAMATISDRFTRKIPAIREVLAPAKVSTVDVIAKRDLDKHYEIIPHRDGELLAEKGVKIKIKDIQDLEDGSFSVKIKGDRFLLVPSDGEEEGLYHLKPLETQEKDKGEKEDVSESESEDDLDFFNDFNDFNDFKTAIPEKTYSYSNIDNQFSDDDLFLDEEFPEEEASSKSLNVSEEDAATEEEISYEEDDEQEKYVIIRNQNGSGGYIVPEEQQSDIVTKGGEKYVLRNGLDYKIEQEKDKPTFQVIGRNIPGMVQLKVPDICFKVFAFNKKTGEKEDLPVDVRVDSPARAEFYRRISMPHFIKAYVASMIFRSQDEKITALSESNVLFTYLPNDEGQIDHKTSLLGAVLIDLDQTFPPNNKISTDPDKPNGVHPIRNGLLGFPQARKNLTEEEMKQTLEIMEEIVVKKDNLVRYLKGFIIREETQYIKNEETGENEAVKVAKGTLSQDQINAFSEVIDKMDTFIKEHRDQSDWTLEDVFFFVFPEYKEQWDKLGKLNPETRAEWIGFYSPKEMDDLYQRYTSVSSPREKAK